MCPVTVSPAPPAVPLDSARVTRLREALRGERGFRLEQLHHLHRSLHRGPLSDAQRQVTLALIDGARVVLREVEAALRRIVDGGYGRCQLCGQPLPVHRLEVLPQVALCLGCQRERDRARPRPGGAAGDRRARR